MGPMPENAIETKKGDAVHSIFKLVKPGHERKNVACQACQEA